MTDAVVMLHAVGDIAFGDHPLCTGFGTHSRCRESAIGFPFQRARPALEGADIVFGNLECTLSERGLRRGDYDSVQMRGEPRYLEDLVNAGFTALNVANNHSLQHGPDAFRDSTQMLQERGITVCGLNRGDYRHARPAIVETNGLRVAFLGYSLRPRQYFMHEPLYAEGYTDAIVEDVRTVRADADNVVVSLHWGSEFIDRPAPQDIAVAHRIIDAGADLIVGHHPHVLRGIGRRGRGIILYSLGNFVCDMIWDESLRRTVVAKVRLTRSGAELAGLEPFRINDDYQPQPLTGEPADQLLAEIEAMSRALQDQTGTQRETEQTYEEAANVAQRINRRRSHRYFLSQLHRFPPTLLLQQFRVWWRNRLSERGLIRASSPTCP